MKKIYVSIALLVFFFHIYRSASAQNPEIILKPFTSGIMQVTDIANAGDERLFVTEQAGIIRIVNADGSINPVPFLDITAIVATSHNEQGLLGLTFHPDYKNNGYFYVNYTAEPNGDTHISRFTVSADSNIADPASEVIIFTQSQPFGNHNAGALHFGPDGYLYFGLGDGGSGGDPLEAGQDGKTYLGKMMRIDVDGAAPYSIPATNPFVGDTAVLDEIWAVGLRNPFKFSFDRATGDMWLPDVGQSSWEEVNFEPAGSSGGKNWGWDCYEGTHAFEPAGCGAAADYDFPVFEYPNNNTFGCSITGGYVYRGSDHPNLQGHYLFADLCSGRLWTLFSDGAGGWDTTDQGIVSSAFLTSFGQDVNGELYLAERSGQIYKITTTIGAGIAGAENIKNGITAVFPNPFNDRTVVKYELDVESEVKLYIMDLLGRRLTTLDEGLKSQGKYEVEWNAGAEKIDPGNYIVVLEAEGNRISKKVLFIK